MKTQIIMFDTPIIVSDEEIKEGDILPYLIQWKDNSYEIYNSNNRIRDSKIPYAKKIIAGLPKLPQIDFNGFEEQLGIVDVDKLLPDYAPHFKELWIEGFKAAQKLNEKKFSLDDLKKAWREGYNERNMDDFITRISQPKVFDIEIEMDAIPADRAPNGWDVFPKITNNSIKIIKVL